MKLWPTFARLSGPRVSEAVGPSPSLAIILRLLGVGAFATMMAMLKYAMLHGASAVDVLFYRNLFAFPAILTWVALSGGMAAVKTQRVGAHALRSGLGITVMFCTFLALSMLPLADATAVGFLAPIFATILSALILKERIFQYHWLALVAGFCGIFIVVEPTGDGLRAMGLAVALTAALGTAGVTILLRQLGRAENAVTTVFWFNLLAIVVTALPMAFTMKALSTDVWWALIIAGLVGGCAQIMITASVRYAPISVLAPFDYTQIIWASGWAFLLFSTPTTWKVALGSMMIIGAGLYIFQKDRLQPTVASLPSP